MSSPEAHKIKSIREIMFTGHTLGRALGGNLECKQFGAHGKSSHIDTRKESKFQYLVTGQNPLPCYSFAYLTSEVGS